MKFLKKIIEIPQKLINGILFSIVYFFGISITFIISKFTKKELFDLKKKKSYWKPYIEDKNNYQMY